MRSEAPNFKKDYPLAGERIGPAWRALWKLLDHEWRNAGDLAAEVAEAHGIVAATVKNLLRGAEKAGLIEKKLIIATGRKMASAHYRVKR